MPRYYFHIRDEDGVVPDEEGCELPSLAAALQEAITSANELVAESKKLGGPRLERWFEILDEKGNVALVLSFADAVRADPPSPPRRSN